MVSSKATWPMLLGCFTLYTTLHAEMFPKCILPLLSLRSCACVCCRFDFFESDVEELGIKRDA
eukprot:4691537-Pleurochrysis_carterae.AAC.3